MSVAADPRTAAAAAAHRRVKRAMGLLRAAAATLAPDAGEVDVVAELHVRQAADVAELEQLLTLALHRHRELDVVILARPRA